MQIVRIHDPERRPASWAHIIRPDQVVIFATDLESGAPCDIAGHPFADPAAATCAIYDSLAEARAAGEAALAHAPAMRIDIFDGDGRANPPLLTLLHPSRAIEADTHPRILRRRRIIAWTLIAAGIPLIVFAIAERQHREIILPAFLGINMLIAAGRLLWFNLGVRETERVRQERLRRHDAERGRGAS